MSNRPNSHNADENSFSKSKITLDETRTNNKLSGGLREVAVKGADAGPTFLLFLLSRAQEKAKI